jgi:ESS family glutamate:Na+ symporter
MEPLYLIILSLLYAIALCLVGELLRIATPGLRHFLLPGAILGGLLAMVFGPQVMDLADWIGLDSKFYQMLGEFPPLFINIVFAALMLGRPIHDFRQIWRRARPQIVMGHIYAWGQYVVGLGVILIVLTPLFDVNPLAGPAIAIGFQGGHGTAAGLESTFQQLGFADGKTIAYAVATFGIVGGTVGGPIIANLLRRRASGNTHAEADAPSGQKLGGGDGKPDRKEDDQSIEFSPLTGSLTVHLGVVGLVILMAFGLLEGASLLESMARGEVENLYTQYIPLFSVVLITGLMVQLLLQFMGLEHLLKRGTLKLISAFGLDMVILGALASLDLGVMGENWITIAILCLAGFGWNLIVFFGLGPRIYSRPWYAYGLGDLGGGTATTATGLLLIRIADPGEESQARAAYTEKQPFYEPFMGGGLVTAFALPVVANVGPWMSLVIVGSILGVWLLYAIRMVRE